MSIFEFKHVQFPTNFTTSVNKTQGQIIKDTSFNNKNPRVSLIANFIRLVPL